MRAIVEEEPLFSFSKLKPFINITFNTPIREEEKLPTALPIPSVITLEVKSNGDCRSPAPSDNDSLFF